jgi:hypothetical protein
MSAKGIFRKKLKLSIKEMIQSEIRRLETEALRTAGSYFIKKAPLVVVLSERSISYNKFFLLTLVGISKETKIFYLDGPGFYKSNVSSENGFPIVVKIEDEEAYSFKKEILAFLGKFEEVATKGKDQQELFLPLDIKWQIENSKLIFCDNAVDIYNRCVVVREGQF